MRHPFKRKPNPYRVERERLMEKAATLDPTTKEYMTVMARIDQLDKILKRSYERTKVFIPAAATGIGVVGIYALQQFAGVIVPKALDAIASRSQKEPKEQD